MIMKLKLKVVIGAASLAAIPVIIACLVIGMTASNDSKAALENVARDKLISARELTKGRIEDYFSTINKQILNLSQNQLTVDAAGSFILGFKNFKKQTSADNEQLVKELTQYYQQDYLEEYKKRNNGKTIDIVNWINQLDDDSIALQHAMIKNNKHPLGAKNGLSDMGNYSSYNRSHKAFHSSFNYYLQQFGYYDIFIADSESGDIVYSVFKEIDFTTSLINGPLSNTGIGQVFKQANEAKDQDFIAISDLSPHLPSYNDPAAFIASPIYENGEKIAILIFQMPIDNINQVMTHQQNWLKYGLGDSGQTYLVAQDKKLRSMDRLLIENKGAYIQSLKNAAISSNIVDEISVKNTSIGLQSASSPKINDALAGNSGFNIYENHQNKQVLSAYAPIDIPGLNWIILSEINVNEAFSSAMQLTDSILKLSISITAILVSLGLLIGFLFANATTKPIIKLSEAINDIEANSDLTKRLEVNSNDEIGMAANSLNLMLEKFHSGIVQVSKASLEIATASEETSTITNKTNAIIFEQKSQTQQVATAITQMSATVQEVSVNINNTAQAAEQANEETATGQEMVVQTVNAIADLSAFIENASTVIHQVEQDSENINSVMEVIKSIAEQTNLLALNAAIEAARAGEQGRGFAVVADEVRTLAGRTQKSTQEIHQMIEKLQSGAVRAVKAMDESNEKAHAVTDQANKAGNSLTVIANAVSRINDMSTQIASAADEQNAVNEDINQNIVSINDMAEETAIGAEQTTVAANKLAQLAEELNVMVEEFKV
jgi:methyl-accepting chemotaxis protein